jgi:hypothetical protein
MENTVESKVSKTILQQQEEIAVGDEIYKVSPPSVATIILASEAISRLPTVKLDSDNILYECMYIAKDCRVLGDIIAILILGAKGLKETRKIVKKRFCGLSSYEVETTVDNKAILAQKLLEDLEPNELNGLMVRLLNTVQLSDFFGLTASLIEINILRRTREMEREAVATTASGQ